MQITPLAIQKLKEFAEDFDAPYAKVGQLTTGGGWSAKVQLGVSLEDSIQEDDECIVIDGLAVLIEKNFYRNTGDKIRIDFVEGQGITVEYMI